jgi:glycosyltransferase involved in cell wall biosynthesis
MQSFRIAIALPGVHRVVRGAETAFEELARQWSILGHDVTLFGSGPARDGEPYRYEYIPCIPREHYVDWPKFPPLRTHYAWEELSFASGLLRKYRPENFDFTVACSYPFINWVFRRGRHGRRPRHIFITQNGDWMLQAHDAEYSLFDCDALVCTNPQFFARHRGRFPSTLIPNGVDPDRFSPGPADRSAFGLPADKKIVLMVSALIPSKRVVEGIQAVSRIDDLFLVVAGDGECRDQVEAEAARALPCRFMRITIPREKMPALYRCADVFLHTSREESSANAYLEALATGLPIVTHDWQVTRWTLEDCGVLVDCSDPSRLVAGLKTALEANTPSQVADRRALARRKFSWSAIGLGYIDFFTSLLEPLPVVTPSPRLGPIADVGVVAIGRNEGERLKHCLTSLTGKVAAIVYVDSASHDGSPSLAASMGAHVVHLDPRQSFSAARARNAGLEKLTQVAPDLAFVQFIDGDCEMLPGWIETARAYLQSRQDLAVVCGRRRELHADKSMYNQFIDLEWNTPIGPAKSCGGDAMMKIAALRQVGPFDPSVMAGEEPELSLRFRNAGWRIWRINAEMTLHDSAIRKFRQLWRRQVRGGYGAIDVFTRFGQSDRLFASQVRSARLWGLYVPAFTVAALLIAILVGPFTDWTVSAAGGLLALIGIAAWTAQCARLAISSHRRGRGWELSIAWAIFTMIGKFAAMQGQWLWRRDHHAGRRAVLIEYKTPIAALPLVTKEVKA